ncbi:MAG: type II secretion system protein [Clostridia bacterium]|nr:type II secretion system protein [Clostridia bacterium]
MQNKKGISLIVLVITIIVMIILAATVVITLSNTGVIDRAGQAVDLTNEAAVQDLAALTWADAYMDNKRGTELVNEVTTKLSEQGITADKWNITISETGIVVTNKNSSSVTGLGSLITAANYGDKVDYTVTVDGTTYSDWQIYYHNSEYVYLISASSIGNTTLYKGTTVASLTSDELALYEKFRVGNADKYTLADTVNERTSYNSQSVAQLIKNYANFANTTTYGTNVVGAIGGPTIELLAAGWNATGKTPTFTITTSKYGYQINGANNVSDLTSDGLYVPSDYYYWLASPSAYDNIYVLYAGYDFVGENNCSNRYDVRPVVCLKSSIPATVGTGDYDFSLVK